MKILLFTLTVLIFLGCQEDNSLVENQNQAIDTDRPAFIEPERDYSKTLSKIAEKQVASESCSYYSFDFGFTDYAPSPVTYEDLTITTKDADGWIFHVSNDAYWGLSYIATYGYQLIITLPDAAVSASIYAYDNETTSDYETTMEAYQNGNPIPIATTHTTNQYGFNQIELTAPAGEKFDYILIKNQDYYYYYVANLSVCYQSGVDISFNITPIKMNSKSKGLIPCNVLSTVDFDAGSIDVSTLSLNGKSISEAHGKGHSEDVNGDGIDDLVIHFSSQDFDGIRGEVNTFTLTGVTDNGIEFSGSDTIFIK